MRFSLQNRYDPVRMIMMSGKTTQVSHPWTGRESVASTVSWSHNIIFPVIKSRIYLAVLLAALVFAPGLGERQADAQTQASEKSGETASALNLDRAVEIAIENDPALRKIQWQIESAQGQKIQQTRRPNPQVGIIANEIFNEGNGGQHGAYISRNIVRNQRFQLRGKAFEQQIRSLRLQSEVRQLRLARSVTLDFLLLARIQREKTLVLNYIESLTSIRGIAEKLVAAGDIAPFTVSNIDLEIEKQRQGIVALDSRLHAVQKRLETRLGREQDSSKPAASIEFHWQSAVSSVNENQHQEIERQLLASHPQLVQADAITEQRRHQIGIAEAMRIPDYQIQSNINYDMESEHIFAGFQLGIPLQVNDRKSGAIRAARADLQTSLENRNVIRRQLRTNLATALGNQQAVRRQLKRLRGSVLAKAKQNEALVQKAFQAGTASFLQLKSSLDTLQQTRISEVDLEHQLLVSQAMVETLSTDQ